jgi:DNA processing protein
MSEARRGAARACDGCLRRSWLLAQLGGQLDYRCRDRERLPELLALDDEALVRALGGRRTGELLARWARFDACQLRRAKGVETVCEHDGRYPGPLRGASAPRMLYVRGGVRRLSRLGAGPVVAIAGSERASDHGVAVAGALARGLALGGVTVASAATGATAAAAHAGARAVGGPTIAVVPGGLDVTPPAGRRSLLARTVERGCAVAELPCDLPGRIWGLAASERTVAALAQVTVLVEAEGNARELAPAMLARAIGRTVAAMPGRVTSPLSTGTNALLRDGAPLVRDALDVLELLGREPTRLDTDGNTNGLDPRLRGVLERVAAGVDTAGRLARAGEDGADVLLALSELELLGLLGRGDGGRYLPLAPAARPPPQGPRSKPAAI